VNGIVGGVLVNAQEVGEQKRLQVLLLSLRVLDDIEQQFVFLLLLDLLVVGFVEPMNSKVADHVLFVLNDLPAVTWFQGREVWLQVSVLERHFVLSLPLLVPQVHLNEHKQTDIRCQYHQNLLLEVLELAEVQVGDQVEGLPNRLGRVDWLDFVVEHLFVGVNPEGDSQREDGAPSVKVDVVLCHFWAEVGGSSEEEGEGQSVDHVLDEAAVQSHPVQPGHKRTQD